MLLYQMVMERKTLLFAVVAIATVSVVAMGIVHSSGTASPSDEVDTSDPYGEEKASLIDNLRSVPGLILVWGPVAIIAVGLAVVAIWAGGRQ